MKAKNKALKIQLFDISENGQLYSFNRTTGELNEILADLIQNEDYVAEIQILPMNNRDFILKGFVKTRAPELCSRCGISILFPLKAEFAEVLIPQQESGGRNGKYSRSNHVSETLVDDSVLSQTSTTEYPLNGEFDLGEFIHEMVALELPINPAPALDENDKCLDCGIDVSKEPLHFEEKNEVFEVKKSPFSVLKNLKIQ